MIDTFEIFNGYSTLKYRNCDFIRDTNFLIESLKGNNLKNISKSYNFSYSEVRRRSYNILVRVRGFLLRKDE